MNAVINNIRLRRDLLFNHYDLTDEAGQKANYLFARMEQFGLTCKDQTEFETRFASSPLNDEYNRLFIEFAAFVKKPDNVPDMQQHRKNTAKGIAASSARHQVKSGIKSRILNALPNSFTDWFVYGFHRIPILGDIIGAKNNMESVGRLFKDKKEMNEK